MCFLQVLRAYLISAKPTMLSKKKYVYGYYPTIASQREQMHLRLTATHHISSLGLLFSLTVEQFTFSNNYIALREIYPYAYMDKNLVYHEIPAAERTHSRYKHLFLTPNETKTVHTPTYHNFHLRITKEMLNGLSISLYANNFLNYRPKITVNGHTSLQNSKNFIWWKCKISVLKIINISNYMKRVILIFALFITVLSCKKR